MNGQLQPMRIVIEAPRIRTILTGLASPRPSSYRLSFPYVVLVEAPVLHSVYVSDEMPKADSRLWEFPLVKHKFSVGVGLQMDAIFHLSHVDITGLVCYDSATKLQAIRNQRRQDGTVNWIEVFWNSPWNLADWDFVEEWARISKFDAGHGAAYSLRKQQPAGNHNTIRNCIRAKRGQGVNWPTETYKLSDDVEILDVMEDRKYIRFNDVLIPDLKLGINLVYSGIKK